MAPWKPLSLTSRKEDPSFPLARGNASLALSKEMLGQAFPQNHSILGVSKAPKAYVMRFGSWTLKCLSHQSAASTIPVSDLDTRQEQSHFSIQFYELGLCTITIVAEQLLSARPSSLSPLQPCDGLLLGRGKMKRLKGLSKCIQIDLGLGLGPIHLNGL